jgi:hypothetical protein
MAKDLQFRHYETLHNLLKMYSREPEEVLVLEAVANGMDAKAKKIEIKIIWRLLYYNHIKFVKLHPLSDSSHSLLTRWCYAHRWLWLLVYLQNN